MAFAKKIELNIVKECETVVVDRSGSRLLKKERLFANFTLAAGKIWHDGLVDTGAYLTVFPQHIWTRYANDIEWISARPGEEMPLWASKISGLTGGEADCRIGLINIHFLDFNLNLLRPITIFAKCANWSDIKTSLIGLGGCVFEGRRLEFEYLSTSAWLHEV
jgi:hypothetical protein